jgi:hypothetical protein
VNHIGFALNEIDATVSGFVSLVSAGDGRFKFQERLRFPQVAH